MTSINFLFAFGLRELLGLLYMKRNQKVRYKFVFPEPPKNFLFFNKINNVFFDNFKNVHFLKKNVFFKIWKTNHVFSYNLKMFKKTYIFSSYRKTNTVFFSIIEKTLFFSQSPFFFQFVSSFKKINHVFFSTPSPFFFKLLKDRDYWCKIST